MFQFPNYLFHRIFIHPKSAPPSDKSIQITPFYTILLTSHDMDIKLKKFVIKRLEKPYDTHCHDYGDSNQEDCLNKCYMKKYLDEFKCLPNQNNYHTFILDYLNVDNQSEIFCPDDLKTNITKFEKHLHLYCNDHVCGTPCFEILYLANIVKLRRSSKQINVTVSFSETTYKNIEYVPKITLMEFVINLINILNLWHGTNFIQVLTILSAISDKLFALLYIHNARSFNKQILIKIISTILSILFTGKLISLSIDLLQFESFTKINLLNY